MAVSAVIKIAPRFRPLTAMRVLIGTTTRGEILVFCPRARVGVGSSVGATEEMDNTSTDIRWVQVPHNGNLWDVMTNDGDWIVQKAPGHFFILTDTDFHREYVIA